MTNENLEKSQLIGTVSSKIESGEVKMRSRRYFVLRTILIGLLTLLVGLFVLYLVSFVLFSLRASGVWFLPSFGWKSLGVFLLSLPWVLFLIAAVSIIVLEVFLKRFAFVWHRPVFYSIIGIVVLATLGSFIIIGTDFHHDLFMRSREGNLPLAGPMYRGFGAPEMPEVHYGIISSITNNGFVLESQMGDMVIIFTSSGSCSLPKEGIKVGDRVIVLGSHIDDKTVQASDVRVVNEPFHIFERLESVIDRE